MKVSNLKLIKKKEDLKRHDGSEGYFIDADEKMARRIIDSLKGTKKIIALQGRDDAFNRRAIETLKINYLVMPEVEPKKDTLKQRDSGINHVLAKEAARKGIAFVIDFNYIRSLSPKEQVKILSRVIQNIKICRKAKAQIKVFAGSNDEKGVASFLTSLGMGSGEVRGAFDWTIK
jgi:ribonuclease P/MRP protein subunit RPP1